MAAMLSGRYFRITRMENRTGPPGHMWSFRRVPCLVWIGEPIVYNQGGLSFSFDLEKTPEGGNKTQIAGQAETDLIGVSSLQGATEWNKWRDFALSRLRPSCMDTDVGWALATSKSQLLEVVPWVMTLPTLSHPLSDQNDGDIWRLGKFKVEGLCWSQWREESLGYGAPVEKKSEVWTHSVFCS